MGHLRRRADPALLELLDPPIGEDTALAQQRRKPGRRRLIEFGQDHDGPLGTYGCVEYYARVSTHVDWIGSVISART